MIGFEIFSDSAAVYNVAQVCLFPSFGLDLEGDDFLFCIIFLLPYYCVAFVITSWILHSRIVSYFITIVDTHTLSLSVSL